MNSETNKELQDLLKQAREYVNYFRELGAETIDEETAASTIVQVTVAETTSPSTTAIAPEVPTAAATAPKPLFARRSEPVTAPAAQTLFGDASPATSSLP